MDFLFHEKSCREMQLCHWGGLRALGSEEGHCLLVHPRAWGSLLQMELLPHRQVPLNCCFSTKQCGLPISHVWTTLVMVLFGPLHHLCLPEPLFPPVLSISSSDHPNPLEKVLPSTLRSSAALKGLSGRWSRWEWRHLRGLGSPAAFQGNLGEMGTRRL